MREFSRLFEECFAADGEKFCGVGGSVMIQQRRNVMLFASDKFRIFGFQDLLPALSGGLIVEHHVAAHLSVETIERVGEFVYDQIAPVMLVASAAERVSP